MRYKKLGRTGLDVSVIGFGASPLGNVFAVTDPAEGTRTVHQAIDQGINFFDVSPYYGATMAERRLGTALAGRRDKVILATKCGRYGADEFDFSAGRVTAGLEESLERLQTDYVDLLQVHDVEFGSVEQITEETLPALRRLQRAGKARFIGITGYSLKPMLAIAAAAPLDTLLTYCHYNLMVQTIDEGLAPAAEAGRIGLINASPLHMGLLSPGPVADWHPAPANVRAAAERAKQVCAAHGGVLAEVALRFCLAHGCVASTLVGMGTSEELAQNLRALEPADPVGDSTLPDRIAAAIGPDLNYVWPSGRAENHD